MKLNFDRALILAPHTDDGEFGCGGTAAKLIEQGCEVYYAAFSSCQHSVIEGFPSDVLVTEVKSATRALGIKPANLILFDYRVRTLNYHRQEILEDMIKLRADINPDLVFMPSMDDIHQDHYTVAQEGLRAFKFGTILCYEMPWNNMTFHTNGFVALDERHVDLKVQAMQAYQSQAHRPYCNEEFIRSLARTRGVQISVHYAETFEVKRWILKD